MASWTPVVLQNENAPTHIGKHGNGVEINAKRPVKRGLQERRSLQDLTNTGKPQVSAPSKGSILKDKSAISSRQRTKNILKGPFLNDELRRCHEWAKDGIEHAYFTGNDLQKLHKDAEDNRVKKKVQKVMSALREEVLSSKISRAIFLRSLKGPFLNDELRRCHEWAKDGIEHAYFTGNDLQKLHKDAEDNRVKKKVQKVMSALREWSTTGHDGSILHTEVVQILVSHLKLGSESIA